MKIYKANIEGVTLENNYYRRVVSTTDQMQVVLMFIQSGNEIGEKVHPKTTQFIRVEGGRGVAIVNDKKYFLKESDGLVIPAGAKHNIISTDHLKLYTIYSPPEYPPNTNEEYNIEMDIADTNVIEEARDDEKENVNDDDKDEDSTDSEKKSIESVKSRWCGCRAVLVHHN